MLEIIDKSVRHNYLFCDLRPGDVFKRYGQQEVYIKACTLDCVPTCNLTDATVSLNAFCVDEREFYSIQDEEEVIPYDAELIICEAG